MDEECTQATQPNDGSFYPSTKPRPWGHLASSVHTSPSLDLYHTEYFFGRKKECALLFKDPRISAEHCRIYRTAINSAVTEAPNDNDNNIKNINDRTATALKVFEPPKLENDFSVYIEDLSSNGTFVNGKRVGKGNAVLLKHKDEIALVGRYGTPNCVAAFNYQDMAVKDLENDPGEDIVSEKYQMGPILGTGNFSSVRLGISKQTGQKFAVKIIDKLKYHHNKALDQITREVDILKQIKHPNIITIIDCIATKRYIYLILELAMGGELFDRIMSIGNYNEDDARKVFVQMLEAVDYLHDRGIAHRDLKPENILLQSRDSNLIKISDFGLAKLVGDREMMTTLCGTPQYAAPEIIVQSIMQTSKANSSTTFAGYGKEVDMWSLGAILYVLLSGTLPFDEDRINAPLFLQIQQGQLEFPPEFWMEVSDDAKDLIRKLMTVDPKSRMDVKQALQHPWVSQDQGTPASQKQLPVSTNLRKNKSHLMSPVKGRPLNTSGNSDTEDEASKAESRSPNPAANSPSPDPDNNNTHLVPTEFKQPNSVHKSSSSKTSNNNTTTTTSSGSKGKSKGDSIIIADGSPSKKKGKENQANFVDLTDSPMVVTKTRPKRKSTTGSQEDGKNTKKKLNFSSS